MDNMNKRVKDYLRYILLDEFDVNNFRVIVTDVYLYNITYSFAKRHLNTHNYMCTYKNKFYLSLKNLV